MPKIHVQYRKGYTVMSNYIFTKDTMSLKAIGLFCYMVSRPEDWNFSIRGLASQLKDGKTSITNALNELKEKKYVKCDGQTTNEQGKKGHSDYHLYQIPYNVDRSTLSDAVFTGDEGRGQMRREKVTNYTILSNYHLLDGDLSLNAKGLLSYLLNLPYNRSYYNTEFLCTRFVDGKGAVNSALKELKEFNYIQGGQTKNEKGQWEANDYYILECPEDNIDIIQTKDFETFRFEDDILCTEKPCTENPVTDKPTTDKQFTDIQTTEKQTAENEPHININKKIINKKNINCAITSSSSKTVVKEIEQAPVVVIKREKVKEDIKERLGYDRIIEQDDELEDRFEDGEISREYFDRYYVNPRYLDALVAVMTEVYCSRAEEIKAGNTVYPRMSIIENFERLFHLDVKRMIHNMTEFQPKNRRSYILAMLYNFV